MQEQARQDFSEAMYEIMSKIMEAFFKKEEKKELSENAKKLLAVFKNDPELAKEVISKYLAKDIEKHAERFGQFNDKALEEINKIKRSVDLSTEAGKDVFESLNYLERIQYDKENYIDNVVSSTLNISKEPAEKTLQNEQNIQEEITIEEVEIER